MNSAFDSLDQKVDLVLTMCEQLRSANNALRDRVVGLEQQNQLLTGRADTARVRLEALMEKLPQE